MFGALLLVGIVIYTHKKKGDIMIKPIHYSFHSKFKKKVTEKNLTPKSPSPPTVITQLTKGNSYLNITFSNKVTSCL